MTPMERLKALRTERETLLARIKPSARGVTELRLRLKQVTHELMKSELGE